MKTVERYQRCRYGSVLDKNLTPAEIQTRYQEYVKLKAKVEILQLSQRHHLGENLGDLGKNDLEHLEGQLEVTLRQIRSTKTHFMVDQLVQLQRKEEMLLETNKTLRSKLEESSQSWQPEAAAGEEQNDVGYNEEATQIEEFGGFYEPLHESNTSICSYNIRGEEGIMEQENVGSSSTQNVHGFIPSWML
ncbi:hypothetical protein ACFE04_025099 [Oxalis oulophora]